MNKSSTLPEHLSPADRTAIHSLITGVEILPLSALFFRADEYQVMRPKNRIIADDFIYVPHRGRLNCHVRGVRREIGPGEFMVVTAGVEHGVTMAEGTEYYEVYALHMHALDTSGNRFLDRLEGSYGILPERDWWFSTLATCVHLMGQPEGAGVPFFKQAVLWLLYGQLMQGNRLREQTRPLDDRISRLLHLIRNNPGRDWSVTRMAKACNLSVSRFRELFGHCIGSPPNKYLQKIRLAHARSLLATAPHLSVEQVARQVGVKDAHYFHAIYKKMFGETPRRRQGESERE